MNRKEPKIYREVGALGWFTAAALILLSLLSFDPNDLPIYSSHTNSVTSNFIGSLGAQASNAFFFLFGLGAYFLPALCLAASIALLFHADIIWRWKFLWVGLFLLSTSCLLHLQPYFGDSWSARVNTVGAGGFFGKTVDDYFLCLLLGQVGAGIILSMVYITSVILLFQLHPQQLFSQAYEWYLNYKARRDELRVGSDPLAKLTAKERLLVQQRRELERELQRHGKTATLPDAPKPPQVIDTSVPVSSTRHETKSDLPGIKVDESAEPQKEPTTKKKEPKASTKPKQESVKPAASTSNIIETSQSAPQAAEAISFDFKDYKLPPLEKLSVNSSDKRPVTNREELQANAMLLVDTLKQFGIESRAGDITKGATITRYEIYPADGVRVDKITSLQRDLARTMKAEKIHILAPIPGKDSVGIEIANSNKVPIVLRDLFETSEWIKSEAKIPLALGKDVYGHTLVSDLAEMPHMLIAGTTGSGKSVCINCILLSLLYRFRPDELRLILVDPKQVELQIYNSIPHLVVPVVTDPKKVLLALRWVIKEMEERYRILAKVGLRNIASFNARTRHQPQTEQLELGGTLLESEDEEDNEKIVPASELKPKKNSRDTDIVIPDHFPYIVVIIDELADLMQTAPADVESAIARLTAKARAAGIHLIVATQTPRREVVTGVIKTNIPSRVAFQVPSALDSRVILDENGAENLLGKGDLLYLPPGSSKLIRGQGAFVSDDEVKKVVDFISAQATQTFNEEIHQKLSSDSSHGEEISNEDQELLLKCFEVIRQEKRASTSMLQRRLRLGYNRAAWVMDHFERMGIVGPENGAKPREILVDLDNYEFTES